jgi:hypothetical protein
MTSFIFVVSRGLDNCSGSLNLSWIPSHSLYSGAGLSGEADYTGIRIVECYIEQRPVRISIKLAQECNRLKTDARAWILQASLKPSRRPLTPVPGQCRYGRSPDSDVV